MKSGFQTRKSQVQCRHNHFNIFLDKHIRYFLHKLHKMGLTYIFWTDFEKGDFCMYLFLYVSEWSCYTITPIHYIHWERISETHLGHRCVLEKKLSVFKFEQDISPYLIWRRILCLSEVLQSFFLNHRNIFMVTGKLKYLKEILHTFWEISKATPEAYALPFRH